MVVHYTRCHSVCSDFTLVLFTTLIKFLSGTLSLSLSLFVAWIGDDLTVICIRISKSLVVSMFTFISTACVCVQQNGVVDVTNQRDINSEHCPPRRIFPFTGYSNESFSGWLCTALASLHFRDKRGCEKILTELLLFLLRHTQTFRLCCF